MPPKKSVIKAMKSAIQIDERGGSLKEIQVPVQATLDECFKAVQAGSKNTKQGFKEYFVWELVWEDTKYTITLYGKSVEKSVGTRASAEHCLPPPLGDTTFVGSCLLVCQEGPLTISLWNDLVEIIYEKYEDADDDLDDAQGSDVEEYSERGSEIDDAELEEEEEDMVARGGRKKKTMASNKDDLPTNFAAEQPYLDCSCELDFESYV
jgi:hypothetical protein